jgi:hypothetical protein
VVLSRLALCQASAEDLQDNVRLRGVELNSLVRVIFSHAA